MYNRQITFDNILFNRIGFGTYQIQALLITGLVDFMGGCQYTIAMLIPPILKDEWTLSQKQLELLGSMLYVGNLVGTLLCSFLCDYFGRKKTLAMGNFISFLCFLYTGYIQFYYEMLIMRFMNGVVLSVTMSVCLILLSEITPMNIRGRFVIMLHIFYSLGKYFILIIASYYIVNLTQGNWRAIAKANALPCLITFLANYFFVDESARYLLIQKKTEYSLQIIDKMIRRNKGVKCEFITQEEKFKLDNWAQQNFSKNFQMSYNKKFLELFKGNLLWISLKLIMIQFIVNFMTAGIYFLLPFLFSNQEFEQTGLQQLFIIHISELPAVIILCFFIDAKKLGRIRTLLIALAISTFILLLIYFFQTYYVIVIGLLLIKFLLRLISLIIGLLTTESYSTSLRAMGIGIGGAIAQLSSAASPMLLYGVYLYDKYAPFLIFAVLFSIGFFVMLKFEIDLTGEGLDQSENIQLQQQSYQQIREDTQQTEDEEKDEIDKKPINKFN